MKKLVGIVFILIVFLWGWLLQGQTPTPAATRAENTLHFKTFKEAFAAGNQSLKEKKWNKAVEAYLQAENLATSDKGKSQALNAQGWALLKEKKWKEAKEVLERSVQADPGYKIAMKNLGLACFRLYDYGFSGLDVLDEAIKNLEGVGDAEELERAKGARTREESYTQVTPQPESKWEGLNYKALTALGDKAQTEGRFGIALKIFKRAEEVGISPAAKGAAANRQGKVLLDARRPSESIPYFERAVKFQPNEKVFLNNLGFSYWVYYDSGKGNADDLKKSVNAFYKANAVDPSFHNENLKMALEELKGVDSEAAKAYAIKEDKDEEAESEESTPADARTQKDTGTGTLK